MKTIALVCTCLLLLASLSAQTVFTGPGGPTRIASSHPLSYWMADPLARDRGGDFTLCLGCKTDAGRVVTREGYTVDPEIHRPGPLSGHQVVDIIDHIHSHIPDWPNEGIWHIVLVETKPGQFTEIYREQTGVDEVLPAKPARAVKVGSADILAVYDPTSGNGGGCSEGYWWFDAAGPHPVDFGPVYKAIGEKTPKDSTYTVGCWTIDLDQHQIHTNVQKIDADCHACGQLGTATASFEIVHGVAKPTKVDFDSDPQD